MDFRGVEEKNLLNSNLIRTLIIALCRHRTSAARHRYILHLPDPFRQRKCSDAARAFCSSDVRHRITFQSIHNPRFESNFLGSRAGPYFLHFDFGKSTAHETSSSILPDPGSNGTCIRHAVGGDDGEGIPLGDAIPKRLLYAIT
jgi:hypothetical protein